MLQNIVEHEGPPPPHAPALVRELFAQPLEAQNASRIFDAAVPPALIRGLRGGVQSRPFDELLRVYLGELTELQAALRAATGEIDTAPLLARLKDGLAAGEGLARIGATVDRDALEKTNARFVSATLRFARDLPLATGFPGPMRLESPIGIVSIGSRGDDRHGPDAALIVDPGGNDVYQRAPVSAARISVIVDLGGNDRYEGPDVAIRGLSAIVDLGGDDIYEARGAGTGAAIVGASIVVDAAGNDRYSAGYFAQGAAAFGFGALVDLEGDDEYVVAAWGQGFATAGGVGLLWDRGGNDSYAAAGEADPFGREALLSGAQGVGFGFRTMHGGGIGMLRDDAGDDRYVAQMFAQGLGYYYGIGVLWDRGGDDRYRAVRYAQGSAAHEAVGVLREESGNDRYELGFGVGQGMGLDVALGVLVDVAGDDDYRAPLLAQAAATANGIGLLSDLHGANRFEVRDIDASWGHGDEFAGLPTQTLLMASPQSSFVRTGTRPAPVKEPPCPQIDTADLWQRVAAVRRDHFDAVLEVGRRLRCAIETAADPAPLWREVTALLEREPATPLANAIAQAARARPAPPRVIEILDRHPRCSVRAATLVAVPREDVARRALGSPCYRLQAAGRRVLGVATDERRPARCSPAGPCLLPPD